VTVLLHFCDIHDKYENYMFIVAAFYHFFDFADYERRRAELLALFKEQNIKGSLLIASEGFNGTISGTRGAVDAVLFRLKILGGEFEHKESYFDRQPFGKAKVRLKKELISLGFPLPMSEGVRGWGIADSPPTQPSPSRGEGFKSVGEYIDPKDWNALISDPNTIVIDTRNTYETYLGSFEGAIDPKTRNFRELPAFVRENLADKKSQKIATFCTGGIRCEKLTAWMKQEGFEHVYHLKGGILKYLEEIDPADSRWNGECYVFDERVAVGHGLTPSTTATNCDACGHTLKVEDRKSAVYIKGIACPYCAD